MTVCRNEPFDLFEGLTGTFNQTGTWYNPSNQALTSSLDTAGNIPGQFNYYYISSSEFCSADTSVVLVNVDGSCTYTSINELEENNISIFPNPSKGTFNLEVNNFTEQKSIEITDIHGREVLSKLNVIQGKGIYQVDLDTQSNGIYFVRVFGKISSKTYKVIKQ
jgi:hypothetical protein